MKKNKGFALITALFLLIVLSAVVGVVVSISCMNRSTINFALQGTRAYFAARSGLEWGIKEVVKNSVCPANTTLSLSQGGVKGFNVAVTCTVNYFVEGTTNLKVFLLTSFASKGVFMNVDYVSREMQVSFVTNN